MRRSNQVSVKSSFYSGKEDPCLCVGRHLKFLTYKCLLKLYSIYRKPILICTCLRADTDTRVGWGFSVILKIYSWIRGQLSQNHVILQLYWFSKCRKLGDCSLFNLLAISLNIVAKLQSAWVVRKWKFYLTKINTRSALKRTPNI